MRMPIRKSVTGLCFFVMCLAASGMARGDGPLERTVKFKGAARKYFVRLPNKFDAKKTYWLLVAVHGGGGRPKTSNKVVAVHQAALKANLPAIVVSPEFNTTDKQVSRFPALGEGAFLREVIKQVQAEYRVHPKILLTGYSMGGQLTHRFALANPDLIQACAPVAAGTWSTPDGKLLIEKYGAVDDPMTFLSSRKNASKVPERLKKLFDARTAKVAGLPAPKGAEKVPFLVMCGTQDTRYDITKIFVTSLEKAGFTVDTAYPKVSHGGGARIFSKHTMAFFKKHISGK